MIFTFYLVVKRLMIRENSVVKIQTIVNQSPALVHSCCIYSMTNIFLVSYTLLLFAQTSRQNVRNSENINYIVPGTV